MRFAFRTIGSLAALAGTASAAWGLSAEPFWTAEGRLEASDSRTPGGPPHDDHRVRLQAGQRLRITLDSDDFDPLLQLYAPGSAKPAAQDDDGGEGLNARLFVTTGETGEYVLRVLGVSEEAAGAYRLGIEALPPLPPPVSPPPAGTEATRWSVYEGTLAGDGEGETPPFEDYLLPFRAGEEVLIRLDSGAFDPVLEVYRPGERDALPLVRDDDSGGETNALLAFRPGESGDYIVRATAFHPEGRGPYRLRVGRQAAD